MTDTEKDTQQVEPLKWYAKRGWGSAGRTHRAGADGWRFCCDLPCLGALWVVRGWGPDGRFFYRDAVTLKAAKQLAEDRLTAWRETGRCTECGRANGHKTDCTKGRAA